MSDVFRPQAPVAFQAGRLSIEDQAPHTVRLIKIIDDSVPAPQPPSIKFTAPSKGQIGAALRFTGAPTGTGVPALSYHWDFGDGVVTEGSSIEHTYTLAAKYQVHLTVSGVDGVPYNNTSTVVISGTLPLPAPQRYVEKR